PLRVSPPREVGVRVAPDDQEELPFGPKLRERVDRERGARTIELDARDTEARLPDDGVLEHAQPIDLAGDGPLRFERRASRRHEQHAVERDVIERGVRDGEMSDMDRIECSAEHSDARHSSLPPSRHSSSSAPTFTVSPSLAPSERSSRSMPLRTSCRWK